MNDGKCSSYRLKGAERASFRSLELIPLLTLWNVLWASKGEQNARAFTAVTIYDSPRSKVVFAFGFTQAAVAGPIDNYR